MYTTIRKNSTKRIRQILDSAALITCYRYDDMTSSVNSVVTADDVMAAGARFEFDRVYQDDEGNLTAGIHQNWFFNAYASVESARRRLTPKAFEQYFGQRA